MPNRVIREDLWTSETVAALHDRTFRFYLCLITLADDYGLLEASYGAIKKGAPLVQWLAQDVAKMLGELADADLLMVYESGGKRYAAVQKWQCYVNSVRPKHPIPACGLIHVRQPFGYKNAATRFAASNHLKHLAIDSGPPAVRQPTASPGPVHEGVRGKREVKNQTNAATFGRARWVPPEGVLPETWAAWLDVRQTKRQPWTENAYNLALKSLAEVVASGHLPERVVAYSAMKGYQGLWAPQTSTKTPSSQSLDFATGKGCR